MRRTYGIFSFLYTYTDSSIVLLSCNKHNWRPRCHLQVLGVSNTATPYYTHLLANDKRMSHIVYVPVLLQYNVHECCADCTISYKSETMRSHCIWTVRSRRFQNVVQINDIIRLMQTSVWLPSVLPTGQYIMDTTGNWHRWKIGINRFHPLEDEIPRPKLPGIPT